MDTILEALKQHFASVVVDFDPVSILVALIAIMHVGFAFMQTFFWRRTARSLTYLEDHAISDARGLGASIASYNLSIAIGLGLSFGMEEGARTWVHIVVMALIAFTAVVGWSTTRGNRILYVRLLPALVTLIAIFLLPIFFGDDPAPGNATDTSGAASTNDAETTDSGTNDNGANAEQPSGQETDQTTDN